MALASNIHFCGLQTRSGDILVLKSFTDMVYGYLNGTDNEAIKAQLGAIENIEIDEFIREEIDGHLHRHQLNILFHDKLKKRDSLVIASLDVLPLTALQFIEFINQLEKKGVIFKALDSPTLDLDTIVLLWKLEKTSRSRRGNVSLASETKSEVGRRKKDPTPEQMEQANRAAELYNEGKLSIEEIMDELGIGSKATLYKRLRLVGIDPSKQPGRPPSTG